MSDPSVEEDELISQEDIDQLMNSSLPEDEADDILVEDVDDDLGELSQDDIDSLLNSNTEGAAGGSVVEDDDEDMELISQDDIDQLMNSGIETDEEKPDGDIPQDDGEQLIAEDIDTDDLGELSQDDIDRLMNTSSGGEPEEEDDEDLEMISQDDIKSLMSGDEDPLETQVPESVQEDEEEPALPDDSDNAENTADVDDKDDDDGWTIAESEAVVAGNSLVSQEAIDDLIRNPRQAPETEPVILDDEPDDELEMADAQADEEPEQEQETVGEENDGSDVTMLDFEEEDEDVSQEDIDALLMEPDEEEDEEDILISQDDIDTLLMAADEEDEDVLGDLMDSDSDDGMDDDLEDEDILAQEGYNDEDEDLEEFDQVVLEGDDDDVLKKPKQAKKAGALKWYRSKLVIACACALVALGITVPTAYFVFFSDKPDNTAGQREIPVQTINTAATQPGYLEVETVEVQVDTRRPEFRQPGNLVLEGFVILAPVLSGELNYITADISIDYSDQRAYHEIQENLSFYRDLIYDSIQKRLGALKQQEVTESDILQVVESTLKKVLPGDYISQVSFKSFKIS